MFWNRNNLYIGVSIGILIPLIVYALEFTLFAQLDRIHWASGDGLSIHFRERTLCMVALCVNILPVSIYRRRRAYETVRGLTIVTTLMAFLWLLYFAQEIFL